MRTRRAAGWRGCAGRARVSGVFASARGSVGALSRDDAPGLGARLTFVCIGAVAVLWQFPIVLATFQADPLFNYRVQLLLSDLAVGALIVVTAWPVRFARPPQVGRATLLWAGVCGMVAAAAVVHSSALAAQTLLRDLGTLAIAFAIAHRIAPNALRPLALVLATGTLFQLVLGTAQVLHGAPLGLAFLGEFADPLLPYGDALAPRGTLGHAYMLAALSLLATAVVIAASLRSSGSRRWIGAAAALAMPVGMTFSRAGVVAALLLGVTLARAGLWRVLMLVAIAVIAPATIASAGWLEQIDKTFVERPQDAPTSRGTLVEQAVELIRREPLFGVGPGSYLPVLRKVETDPARRVALQPVHDVPLLEAAEAGIPAGMLAAAIVVLALVRAARRGPQGLVAAVYVPFLVFDQFLISEPQGLVLLGIWLGASDALGRRAEAPWSHPQATARSGTAASPLR